MKRFVTLPAIAAAIIFIGISSISMIRYPDNPGIYQSNYTDNNFFYEDTLPPIPDKLPKIKAPKFEKPKTENLLKAIGKVFQFRKRARTNEKSRVIDIINELSLTDSINASAEVTRFMIQKLSDTVNQNYDSLLALIRDIKEYQRGDSIRQMDLETKYREFTEFKKAGLDKYSITPEKDLNLLASQIFTIINFKTEVTDLRLKIDRVKMLDDIRDSIHIPRIVTDSLGNTRKYYVTLKNIPPVYGFYTFENAPDNNRYRFGHLNTLLYGNIVINSQTGDMRYLNGMDTTSIIDQAQKAGCNVGLTFTMGGLPGLHDFMRNNNSQENFISTALRLVKFRNATAINISMGYLSPDVATNYTMFIQKLWDRMEKTNTSIKLLITLPATITGNFYQLAELNKYCDGFIADFSNNYRTNAGPLASLAHITDVVSFFMTKKVPSANIIVSLPFRGTKWLINSPFGDKHLEYISYKTLRKNYPFPAYTNSVDSEANVVMDSLNVRRTPIRRIYYDDENTFATKFEFIKKNKLGGAAIYNLNDNGSYPELWDEIAYAFANPDTTYIPGDFIVKRNNNKLTFWEEWSQRFALYNYILQNPCEICFENNPDPEQRERFAQYMSNLKIDSLMQRENQRLMQKHEDTYRSEFEYVNWQLTKLLRTITLIIFIILVGLGIFYFYKIKNKGDKWEWKKVTVRTLIVIANLFILFVFTWVFSSNTLPFFGASVSANSGYSKDYGNYANKLPVNGIRKDTITNMGYCEINASNSDCINMPLQTLLGIVTMGLIIGFLITRYLIMPLLKREDVP